MDFFRKFYDLCKKAASWVARSLKKIFDWIDGPIKKEIKEYVEKGVKEKEKEFEKAEKPLQVMNAVAIELGIEKTKDIANNLKKQLSDKDNKLIEEILYKHKKKKNSYKTFVNIFAKKIKKEMDEVDKEILSSYYSEDSEEESEDEDY